MFSASLKTEIKHLRHGFIIKIIKIIKYERSEQKPSTFLHIWKK